MDRKKVSLPELLKKKQERKKIVMLTCYDFPMGCFMEEAGIDMVLVGDSLGMVVLGYKNTLPVTMEEMIHHTKAVSRGAKSPLLIGDMPFMAYHKSVEDAIWNAGRFIKEGGADAIKLEGGARVAHIVEAIVKSGIPVMGHIGLTPQSMTQLGGFVAQGKTADAAKVLIDDAKALEDAGAFSILLEAIPEDVGQIITEKASIPIIGIGAGKHCDGQLLILNDLLGIFELFTPKFVKKYANLSEIIVNALKTYKNEVEIGVFPAREHTYNISEGELKILREKL
ncbi:MAG: 3-methyl-2-oxobutanoate hydroxymethyltransferase [candidate division WS2 bacterium]|uniref:3-methyl-2-oxobutanoate hydroxymethyltransferase n=1 Tax=Psychracetigena formicireducens TaxID=2986056 RepID=A0A9E2F677_PSYF1|nr:3-methyl-2-oxobutanoate hydroxymethyltransferase [Candidatus Psychracetigena formicireducens]MBT9144313.1 3-methyl-2-oxobutanoate hydroxymethyltransferase [Candidatus Psychracetigena formicireducens]MBT9151028.1 3-methyl-2-oxobutanoate hydroxymethyltransferase [Candidatus Psychracetigena formicireducens]